MCSSHCHSGIHYLASYLYLNFINPSSTGEGGCRDLKFLKCIQNKTLTGHVISTIRMATPALQLCQNKCFRERKCVSYNLGPVHGHARSCELNAADHSTRPSFLVDKKGYEYCPIKVKSCKLRSINLSFIIYDSMRFSRISVNNVCGQ